MSDLIWTACGTLLVVTIALFPRALRRVAPSWLAPAHLPLWGLAGASLAVAAALAASLHPALSALWGPPLEAAQRGPSGRFAALAAALAALLALTLLFRLLFAALRPRRAARAPVPAAFLLFAIAPDGTPLEALRRRLRVVFAVLTLGATLAAPLLPQALDPSLWAACVAALTGLSAAFTAVPHPTHVTRAAAAAPPLPAPPALWPFQVALLAEARRTASLAVAAPAGAGKTHAALVFAGDQIRAGHPVLWLVPTEAARAALSAQADTLFASEPAIERAADLAILTPAALDAALAARALPTAIGLVVVDQLEAWTGAELGRARFLVHRVVPDGAPRFLALGALGEAATRHAAELVSAARPDLFPSPHGPEIVGTPASSPRSIRILAPPPQDAALGRTLARTALRAALSEGTQSRARLERVFSPALVESELRVLREAGVLLEGTTSRVVDGALVLVPTARILGDAGLPELGPVLRLREARSGKVHTLPRALADLNAFEGAILDLDGARWEVEADDADRRLVPPTADLATPIRTLKLVPDGPIRQSTHRLRGPTEYKIGAAKLLLHARHTGVRHYRATSSVVVRVHSAELPTARLAVPFPTEARFIVLPTADPIALHTLAHAARDVLPTLFQGAQEDVGVTYALPAELGLAAHEGALVLWDRHPEGLGAVADLTDDDHVHLLAALRAKLADCDCQSSCARCVERPSCTLTPHNVGLDRRRALAVLDALLIPAGAPQALRNEPLRKTG